MIARFERSPQTWARVAGLVYLAIIVLGLFGELAVRGTLVVGDAAATFNNIAAAQPLWRAGIGADLLMQLLDVPLIVIFYLLLRPISEGLALLATFFNLVQTAVLALNKLSLLLPLFLLGDASYLQAFTAAQLQAMAMLAIQAHAHGFGIGLLFFGLACLVHGHLMFKSGYLPKALGVLLQVAGFSYLANSGAMLLAPGLAQAIFPAVLVPAFVGELAVCLWLVFRGVDAQRWAQRPRP